MLNPKYAWKINWIDYGSIMMLSLIAGTWSVYLGQVRGIFLPDGGLSNLVVFGAIGLSGMSFCWVFLGNVSTKLQEGGCPLEKDYATKWSRGTTLVSTLLLALAIPFSPADEVELSTALAVIFFADLFIGYPLFRWVSSFVLSPDDEG